MLDLLFTHTPDMLRSAILIVALLAVTGFLEAGCTVSPAPRGPATRCWGGEVLTPLPSLGQDESPVHVRHALKSISTNNKNNATPIERDVMFEREMSGTTATLHAVGRIDVGHFLAVGDRGAAVLRDRERGWLSENTGTDADLVAFDGIVDRSRTMMDDRFQTVVIGSKGTTLARSLDGHWRREESGTSQDLHAITSNGRSLVAVGDAGTIIERLPLGKWRSVASGVNVSLASVRGCGLGRICALSNERAGAALIIVVCSQEDGRLVCVAQQDAQRNNGGASTNASSLALDSPAVGAASAPNTRVRSQKTKRDWLAQIAIAQNGDIFLSTNQGTYEPASVTVNALALPFATRKVLAVDLDAAEGFLVGEEGLVVHATARPWMVRPTTCEL